ncbi:hypothetical protein D3C84_1020010 [compost metagenome]
MLPVMVRVTVAGRLSALPSLAMYWKVTVAVSPVSRPWKSLPGAKPKVPLPLLVTVPPPTWLPGTML